MVMLLPVPLLDPPPIPAPESEVAFTDPPLMVMLLPVPPLLPPPIPAPESEVAVTDPPLMVMLLPVPPLLSPPIPAPNLLVAINSPVVFGELSIVSLAALSFCKAAFHSLLRLLFPFKYMET